MNKTQLETFIKTIKERSQNPRLIHLCEAFQAFMDLYSSRNCQQGSSKSFEKKLKSSYRAMWESFDAAAESFGFDGRKFLELLANPESLPIEGQEHLSHLRQSIEAMEGPALSGSEKKKLRTKNVRI